MTLPASGPLSLNDIQTEFGGTNPIGMNEYYAGGGLVPSGTTGTFGAVPTSGALSVQNFYGTSNYIPVYIEELFSTYLYTGTNANLTINNGIDLAGKGGLAWFKSRSNTRSPTVFDTINGTGKFLSTDANSALNTAFSDTLTAFNANGFSLGQDNSTFRVNEALTNYVSWTFREQPKFFDMVTYTGNGTAGRTVAHNLGSLPGFMLVKCTSTTSNWRCYHRSLGGTKWLQLNSTGAAITSSLVWNNTNPTSTEFTVGATLEVNQSGETYVAYLFAHNAGGFGLTGTDNVISCGSYTGNGGLNGPTVTLGYEPQWLLIKNASGAGSWPMFDSMRGLNLSTTSGAADNLLDASTSSAEFNNQYVDPNATGFRIMTDTSNFNSSGATYVYIAIRRGPMKVPTTGTSVFAPFSYTGNSSTQNITNGVLNKGGGGLVITKTLAVAGLSNEWTDSLRGTTGLSSTNTNAEGANSDMKGVLNNGFSLGFNTGLGNQSGRQFISYEFARAPGFFDEVCYTGISAAMTVAHNLTVAPELMIVKRRNSTDGWAVYAAPIGNTKYVELNTTTAPTESVGRWNNTSPTSSVFTVGTFLSGSGDNYVAYLFATCPNVSKVGNYTGNGSSQTINCGFTSGARFVLLKRTDGPSAWYLWDSARGISSSNDPYLLLNSTDAQVTSTNWVDTASTGFRLTNAGDTEVNILNWKFTFLAIA